MSKRHTPSTQRGACSAFPIAQLDHPPPSLLSCTQHQFEFPIHRNLTSHHWCCTHVQYFTGLSLSKIWTTAYCTNFSPNSWPICFHHALYTALPLKQNLLRDIFNFLIRLRHLYLWIRNKPFPQYFELSYHTQTFISLNPTRRTFVSIHHQHFNIGLSLEML